MSFFTLSEQLQEPYKTVFDRVYLYASVQEIPDEVCNDAMLNLYDSLFTAQSENKPVEQIVGDDIEVFCQSYFEQRKLYCFLTSLPDRFYQWGKWIFGVEAFFTVGDWLTGQLVEEIDLSIYIFVLLSTLLMIPSGRLLYYFLIQKGHRKIGFFSVVSLSIAAILFAGSFFLSQQFVWLVPRFWVLGLLLAYLLPYKGYQVIRSYQKFGTWYNRDEKLLKEEMKAAKKSVFAKQVRKEVHKDYAKHFKKKQAIGMTSQEFYQEQERKLQRDARWNKWLVLFGVVLVVGASIPVYLSDPLPDALIFTLLQGTVVGVVLYWAGKLSKITLTTRKMWLQEAAPYRANLQEFFDQKETDK